MDTNGFGATGVCGATGADHVGMDGDPYVNISVLRFQLEEVLAGLNAHETQLQGGARSRSVSSASLHELEAMETKLTEALAEIQTQRRKIEQQGH